MLTYMYKKSLDIPFPAPSKNVGTQTRSSRKITFTLPKPNSDRYRNSFAYAGVIIWNGLSADEQLVHDMDLFKIQQKRRLLALEKEEYGVV